eukprot:6194028-Pleurochrysis_carterae.AAC.1
MACWAPRTSVRAPRSGAVGSLRSSATLLPNGKPPPAGARRGRRRTSPISRRGARALGVADAV